jgi:hypothetical protein
MNDDFNATIVRLMKEDPSGKLMLDFLYHANEASYNLNETNSAHLISQRVKIYEEAHADMEGDPANDQLTPVATIGDGTEFMLDPTTNRWECSSPRFPYRF